MSMKQELGSIGLWNIRRNSKSPTARSSSATSAATAVSVASSVSARASSKSSVLSLSRWLKLVSVPTTWSSCFFSFPSSCARLGSFHMPGFSSSLLTAANRSDFASKSKIPPEIRSAPLQAGKRPGQLVELFGFHEWVSVQAGTHYTPRVVPDRHRWNGICCTRLEEPQLRSRQQHGRSDEHCVEVDRSDDCRRCGNKCRRGARRHAHHDPHRSVGRLLGACLRARHGDARRGNGVLPGSQRCRWRQRPQDRAALAR